MQFNTPQKKKGRFLSTIKTELSEDEYMHRHNYTPSVRSGSKGMTRNDQMKSRLNSTRDIQSTYGGGNKFGNRVDDDIISEVDEIMEKTTKYKMFIPGTDQFADSSFNPSPGKLPAIHSRQSTIQNDYTSYQREKPSAKKQYDEMINDFNNKRLKGKIQNNSS